MTMITMQEAKRRHRLAFPLYDTQRETVHEVKPSPDDSDTLVRTDKLVRWESGKARTRRVRRTPIAGAHRPPLKAWVRQTYGDERDVCPKIAAILGRPLPAAELKRRAEARAAIEHRKRMNELARQQREAKPKVEKQKKSKSADEGGKRKGG